MPFAPSVPARGCKQQAGVHMTKSEADWLASSLPERTLCAFVLEPELESKLNQARIVDGIVDNTKRSWRIDVLFAGASCPA